MRKRGFGLVACSAGNLPDPSYSIAVLHQYKATCPYTYTHYATSVALKEWATVALPFTPEPCSQIPISCWYYIFPYTHLNKRSFGHRQHLAFTSGPIGHSLRRFATSNKIDCNSLKVIFTQRFPLYISLTHTVLPW